MTRHNRISVVHQKDGSLDIVVPASMVKDFETLVKKGTNTAPNMHVEIRDFADRVLKRDHIMNNNMKWELPAEDKYEVEVIKQNCPSCSKPLGVANPLCGWSQYHTPN